MADLMFGRKRRKQREEQDAQMDRMLEAMKAQADAIEEKTKLDAAWRDKAKDFPPPSVLHLTQQILMTSWAHDKEARRIVQRTHAIWHELKGLPW